MKMCNFNIAWVGRCKEPVVGANGSDNPFVDDSEELDYCKKHLAVKCKCGKQATRNCSDTIGPMVCGAPLCDECRCNFKGFGY